MTKQQTPPLPAGGTPVDCRVSRPAPKREAYTGVGCMCVITGCRAGPGCPHYCGHCKQHIAYTRGQL